MTQEDRPYNFVGGKEVVKVIQSMRGLVGGCSAIKDLIREGFVEPAANVAVCLQPTWICRPSCLVAIDVPMRPNFDAQGCEKVGPASVVRVLEFQDDRSIGFDAVSGVGLESYH